MNELRSLFAVQIVRGGLLRSDGVGVGLVGGGAPQSELMSRHERSLVAYSAVTVRTELLADNPTLARSIRNRFPYLDPLNHVQVELLRRYRAGQTDERTKRAIHLTINGLAAGLRNSG